MIARSHGWLMAVVGRFEACQLNTVLRTCCRVLSMTLWYSSVHPILIRSIYSTINQVSSNNIIILSFEIEFDCPF